LVINGDFLDFVQAAPWWGRALEGETAEGLPLCFTERQSADKFEAIRRAHPRVFDALGRFLTTNENNLLVVLPGNHDPDFFWPEIRARFAEAVCGRPGSAQIRFWLTNGYRPADRPWIWIEHGHQHDPANAFVVGGEERWTPDKPPIFKSIDGTYRLYECTGTRFMIRYLNALDERYPYVDNVKPFSRFLRIFGASALIPGWAPLDAAIATTMMIGYLTRTAAGRRRDLLGLEILNDDIGSHPLVAWVQRASDNERSGLANDLRARGFVLQVPLEMALERTDDADRLIEFLSEHLDIVADIGEKDLALLGASPGTLTLKTGFTANETEDLYTAARSVAHRTAVTTVVMGHTHEPIERSGAFTFFNTGSWTRYYRFGDKEKTEPWRLLRERSYERFPYLLHYIEVQPGSSSATMKTWLKGPQA
jgi:hypothetical protein